MEILFKKLKNFFWVLFIPYSFLGAQPLKIKKTTDLCNPDSVVIGRISPEIKGVDLSGLEIPISTYRGNYVCIMAWASSKKSSQIEYPYFNTIRQHFKGKNIRFIDISVDLDKKDWEFYLNQNPDQGIHWYADPLKPPFSFYLLKRKNRGEKNFFTYTVPQYILLDRDGRIIENNIPIHPTDSVRFQKLIESLPKLH